VAPRFRTRPELAGGLPRIRRAGNYMTTADYTGKVSLSLPRKNLDFIRSAAVVAVSLQFTYLFAFNHAPELVRTAFAGTLFAMHVALAALSLGRPQTWQATILLSIAMTLGCWLVTHGFDTGSTQFETVEAFRVLSIYVMPLWLLAFPEVIPHRLVMLLAVGSTLIGGIIALSGPPVYASGTPRLASITGGVTQYHPSAWFIAYQLVLVHEYYRARMFSRFIAWPAMLFALMILIGYGGRGEGLLVGSYFATLGYFRFRSVPAVRWSPPILLVLFVIVSAVALSFGHNVYGWGSGRIGVWQHRLGLIWDRDLLTFLFGGGLRSDLIWNPQWWYFDESSAHNDFLHAMMETGLLGLIATVVFLAGLLMRLPGSSKSIVIATAISSFFSNGHFQSPLLAFNLFIVTAGAFYGWHVRYAEGRTDPPLQPHGNESDDDSESNWRVL
jgi:hypothetical protein